MTSSPKDFDRFLGFDVAKKTVTVFDTRSGQTDVLDNRMGALCTYLRTKRRKTFAVCEATGGYEVTLLMALSKLGILAHRADAVKVKSYIRSFGTLAKTDAIDARALAHYAQERHQSLKHWVFADEKRRHLQSLVQRRADLVAMRTAERNRLQAPNLIPTVSRSVKAVLKVIDVQVKALEQEIKTLIQSHERLKQANDIVTSIEGVGPVTASTLLALMPELGMLTRRQVASLAGIAPHPKDSGNRRGYRRIRGGRPQVRNTLFMAAMSARRHNPKMRDFYETLIQKGKKPIVAIAAIMRRLIVIMNAKLRDGLQLQQS